MSLWPVLLNRSPDAVASADLPWRYLAPSALFLLVLPTNHTMALRMTFLFLGLIMAVLAGRRWGMPAVPIRWPLLAWAGLALLSLTWSAQPEFSFAEFKKEVAHGMAAFFGFFILTWGRRELAAWVHIAIASLALTLVLALWGYHYGYSPEVIPYMRWDAVHGYASYGTYLSTVVPFIALWLAWGGRRLRWIGGPLLVLYAYVAYLLGNRMLWISAAAALVVFTVFWAWRHRGAPARLRRGLIPLLAGVLTCGVLFVSVAQQRPIENARPSVVNTDQPHLIAIFAKSERLYIWSYWVERIQERPWTGVGFGRDLPHWVYEKPKDWPDLYFAHAHNLVLDYGLQLGVPGILAVLWLFGAIAARFWLYARSREESLFLAGVTGLALVVSFFSKNLTDELFWRTDALVFWSLTGALLGYGERKLREVAASSS